MLIFSAVQRLSVSSTCRHFVIPGGCLLRCDPSFPSLIINDGRARRASWFGVERYSLTFPTISSSPPTLIVSPRPTWPAITDMLCKWHWKELINVPLGIPHKCLITLPRNKSLRSLAHMWVIHSTARPEGRIKKFFNQVLSWAFFHSANNLPFTTKTFTTWREAFRHWEL